MLVEPEIRVEQSEQDVGVISLFESVNPVFDFGFGNGESPATSQGDVFEETERERRFRAIDRFQSTTGFGKELLLATPKSPLVMAMARNFLASFLDSEVLNSPPL